MKSMNVINSIKFFIANKKRNKDAMQADCVAVWRISNQVLIGSDIRKTACRLGLAGTEPAANQQMFKIVIIWFQQAYFSWNIQCVPYIAARPPPAEYDRVSHFDNKFFG